MKIEYTAIENDNYQRKTVDINALQIPDLWHLALEFKDAGNLRAYDAVMTVWHIAHDLKKHIEQA